jgi:hypothetical protein
VQLEEPAQEPVDEPQILLAVREPACRAVGLFEPLGEVCDLVAQRGHALARDLLADEVAYEQAQERVALQRHEGHWCMRVLAQRRNSA